VTQQVREKLGRRRCADADSDRNREEHFEGVVDLITMKAWHFDGSNGEKVRVEEIPADLEEEAARRRHHMLESLSMYSDELDGEVAGRREVPRR